MRLNQRIDKLEMVITPDKHPVQPAGDGLSYICSLPESAADWVKWLTLARKYIDRGVVGFRYHPPGARVSPDFLPERPFSWSADKDLTYVLWILDWIYRSFEGLPLDVPGLVATIDATLSDLQTK